MGEREEVEGWESMRERKEGRERLHGKEKGNIRMEKPVDWGILERC